MIKRGFTSTDTVGLLGTEAQDVHLDFPIAPEVWLKGSTFNPFDVKWSCQQSVYFQTFCIVLLNSILIFQIFCIVLLNIILTLWNVLYCVIEHYFNLSNFLYCRIEHYFIPLKLLYCVIGHYFNVSNGLYCVIEHYLTFPTFTIVLLNFNPFGVKWSCQVWVLLNVLYIVIQNYFNLFGVKWKSQSVGVYFKSFVSCYWTLQSLTFLVSSDRAKSAYFLTAFCIFVIEQV